MANEKSQISIVMQYAMKHARQHYSEQGWEVVDVSRLGGNHIGYDFLLIRDGQKKKVEVKGCTGMYGIPDLYGNEIDANTMQLIADELCIVYYRPLEDWPPIAIIPRESIPPELIVPKLAYRISGKFKKSQYMDPFFIHKKQDRLTEENA